MILAPTHEEEVTKLIGSEIDSVKSLPVRVYQIGRKFRDEPRPRAGLLRTKEFLMKDLYTFDATAEEATSTYADVRQAYHNIFHRIFNWSHLPSLPARPTWIEVCLFVILTQAAADSGSMGGSFSHEYHVEDSAGEDTLFSCDHCSYASNQECATALEPSSDVCSSTGRVHVHLYSNSTSLHVAVVPAGTSVNPSAAPFSQCQPYQGEGNLPVYIWLDTSCSNVPPHQIVDLVRQTVADARGCDLTDVPNPSAMKTSAIRLARVGDTCASCGVGHLQEHRAIEVGHTFLLGTKYSAALGYGVVPRSVGSGSQKKEPLQMGCYGIGVTRILGALAQTSMNLFHALQSSQNSKTRAREGFVWPSDLAPFSALVLPASHKQMEAALKLCSQLASGFEQGDSSQTNIQVPLNDIALDDRVGQSLGSRLFDADLLGYPYVYVLGKHFDKTGQVEIRQVGQDVQYAPLV